MESLLAGRDYRRQTPAPQPAVLLVRVACPEAAAVGLRTVYLGSNRPGSFGYDIWRSQRSRVADRFPSPTLVTELQATGNQYPTWLSPDNCRLYIDSDAAGAGDDILVADRQTRERHRDR
jgi:hypothetical protein